MITDAQSRMARAAVRWTVRDLAYKAEVSAATVNRFETGRAEPNRATLAAIQRALEAGGVEFLPDNGVKLKPGQVAQVSHRGGGSDQGVCGTSKRAPRKPSAKPLVMSKEAQIRARREQGR